MQRFLYGTPYGERQGADERRPIRLFARSGIEALHVEVHTNTHWHERRRCFRVPVDRCNLYLFDTGNALLAVEPAFDPVLMAALKQQDGFAADVANLRLDDALALVATIRQVFPPFFQTASEAKACFKDLSAMTG